MSRVVLLDAGPLGAACNPLSTPAALACTQWLQRLTSGGVQIIIPEITDYEVRRELIRGGMPASIAKLDQLAGVYRYLPVTTDAWRQAATFWAVVRNLGRPAAGDQRLDCDAILAAQAATLNDPNVVVATTNVGHLSRFVAAELWHNIHP